MKKLVLIRHGESNWNKENRFTGWTDVDLSEVGRSEAKRAGQQLKAEGFIFDRAFTSVLSRAIRTLNVILDEMDLTWIPVTKHWELNERHYGALQGLNKAETAAKHGDEQVFIWRRSYDLPPPPIATDDSRHPQNDSRYANIPKDKLPSTESLKDTVARVIPFWEKFIAPEVKAGKSILVAAHGNSLRALIKYLENISDEEIAELNLPTAVPIVYELTDELKPIRRYYIGDAETIAKATHAVANQAKTKGH